MTMSQKAGLASHGSRDMPKHEVRHVLFVSDQSELGRQELAERVATRL